MQNSQNDSLPSVRQQTKPFFAIHIPIRKEEYSQCLQINPKTSLMETLDLTDIEGWKVAETEGWKMADTGFQGVADTAFKKGRKWGTIFYCDLRVGMLPTHFFFYLALSYRHILRGIFKQKTMPATFQRLELQKKSVGHFPELRKTIDNFRSLQFSTNFHL